MKYCRKKIEECVKWVEENGLQDYGGATLKDFCHAMGIDYETYYHWMKKSEFSDAIQKAKENYKNSLEEKLVRSLAKSAEGYEWEEVVTEFRPNKDGKPEVKGQRKTKKHVPSNIGAAIFLLTNVNNERWKNKQNLEGNLSVNAFEQLMKTLDADEEDEDFSKNVDEGTEKPE